MNAAACFYTKLFNQNLGKVKNGFKIFSKLMVLKLGHTLESPGVVLKPSKTHAAPQTNYIRLPWERDTGHEYFW